MFTLSSTNASPVICVCVCVRVWTWKSKSGCMYTDLPVGWVKAEFVGEVYVCVKVSTWVAAGGFVSAGVWTCPWLLSGGWSVCLYIVPVWEHCWSLCSLCLSERLLWGSVRIVWDRGYRCVKETAYGVHARVKSRSPLKGLLLTSHLPDHHGDSSVWQHRCMWGEITGVCWCGLLHAHAFVHNCNFDNAIPAKAKLFSPLCFMSSARSHF